MAFTPITEQILAWTLRHNSTRVRVRRGLQAILLAASWRAFWRSEMKRVASRSADRISTLRVGRRQGRT